MRGNVAGMASPYSFGRLLPAVFQEDDFALRWMSALDEVLAPVVSVLDNVEHYFDPELAPADFLAWLAAWAGVDELDETWPEQGQRELVAEAVALFRVRGTVAGLKRHLAIYTGAEPEIEESGGCAWSGEAGSPLPGDERPRLVVRVAVPTPLPVELKRLDLIVAASKPAHLPHRVELVGPGGRVEGADDRPRPAGAERLAHFDTGAQGGDEGA